MATTPSRPYTAEALGVAPSPESRAARGAAPSSASLAGGTVFLVLGPAAGVARDVGANAVQFRIVADDAFVVIAMPQSPVIRRPSVVAHADTVIPGRHRFEPPHDGSQGQRFVRGIRLYGRPGVVALWLGVVALWPDVVALFAGA